MLKVEGKRNVFFFLLKREKGVLAVIVTLLVNHNNFSDRMASCWRCFIQISALSTVDGRIEAYHGCNG